MSSEPLKNNRHELFCQNIARGDNQTQAYIKAGYKQKEDTARIQASHLITNNNIIQRISYLKAQNASKGQIDRDKIIETLNRVINESLVDTDRTSALKAMDILNKMGGYYSEKRVIETTTETVNEVAKAINNLVGKK